MLAQEPCQSGPKVCEMRLLQADAVAAAVVEPKLARKPLCRMAQEGSDRVDPCPEVPHSRSPKSAQLSGVVVGWFETRRHWRARFRRGLVTLVDKILRLRARQGPCADAG